jgi:hypothetical protein
MGHKNPGKAGPSLSLYNPRGPSANQTPLKGVSRLVNPPSDEPEIVAREKDSTEREYVGRLLHVADEALNNDKNDKNDKGEHRKRRGRIH